MTVVDIHAAGADLSRLVQQAAAGEEIVIAEAGKPVARLVALAEPPTSKPGKRQLGRLAGMGTIPDDFDAPLPDDILALFEGR